MEFLKDLLLIQQQETLKKISSKLPLSNYEKDEFITKYSKKNYCLLKVGNYKLPNYRVKIKDLLCNLECDHNPSLSR